MTTYEEQIFFQTFVVVKNIYKLEKMAKMAKNGRFDLDLY